MGGRRLDPPGTTPWDRWNGARVGGMFGAIVGAVAVLFVADRPLWPVLVVAAAGAVVGYIVEERRSRRPDE